ncbi:MAG: hypothetical protein NTV72_02345 [Candidatus Taylorbacteria bacterium]|nr:hypothetical protein [Candidatus Taylorbacteria bacterium]
MTEVISGLNEGDLVITKTITGTAGQTTSTARPATSLLGGGGGGGARAVTGGLGR